MKSTARIEEQEGIDYEAIKARQRAVWASGDYGVVGTTLQIVGESLCEALDLRPGASVVDVAAGNGNATLAAARRWADVTSTDYVPELLEQGRRRAEAEGKRIFFREADAEALPFEDASFDVALSTFGVMFAPDQERAAAELVRVVKPGGRIGLASWTPESFVGQMLRAIGRHVPPPKGVKSPALWGTRYRLFELFGESTSSIQLETREFVFRYRSPLHFVDVFRNEYGPMKKAFATLDAETQQALTVDLFDIMGRGNRASDGTLVIPSEYLEVVLEKNG